MEQAIQVFINLIRSALTGQALPIHVIQKITPKLLPSLYEVAEKQNQMHMVAFMLKQQEDLVEDHMLARFSKTLRLSLYRHEMFLHAQNDIYQVFEEAGVDYVPLKGAVIRDFYPQPWMRTSGDIDILVHEKDIDRAKKALISKLNYQVTKHNYHDIAMLSPENMVLELHFKLSENEEKIDPMLTKVWEYVSRVGNSHRMEMTNEYLIFYSYAHMLYHFINGGCGVRYVIDIWLLEQKLEFDSAKLEKLLDQSGMCAFAHYTRKLARVWLEGEAHDNETTLMEMYIMEAGLFGDTKSKVKARKVKTEGKGKYLFQRVFIPYKEFCSSYPILSKYPLLYPFFTVKRWFKIFDRSTQEQAKQEIQLNQEMDSESISKLRELFRKLDI